ncbi:MAG: hypothetical protein OHK0028_18140 [Deltaproteobacteria bacterium]
MRLHWIVILAGLGILPGPAFGGEAGGLVIPGTGACEAVLKSVAAAYEHAHPLARVVIPPSVHSEGGIRKVINGDAVLARVSRPLTAEEADSGLSYRVFARDAVVFAVGAGVRVRGLTIRQIADLFSGRADAWEQVGGGKGPVRVLLREEGDSSLRILRSRFPEFRELRFPNRGKVLYHDEEMVEMLQKYRNSIGFATMSSLGAAVGTVTPLAVDGIAPTTENVASNRYPVRIEYAIVYREGALPAEARAFVDFLFSREGGIVLAAHGLAPVPGR